jgi:rhamnosyltransferase
MPTRNGAATLPAVLDGISRQQVPFVFETIAVDSASTDGTVEILRKHASHVVSIDGAAFNHGLTRNLGIEAARGELVVLMVQDAVPMNDRWLAALTAPLFQDDALAGTYARQVPRDDATAVTRYYAERWVAAATEERTMQLANAAALEALDPFDRFLSCAFDNVCSCIRRTVWQRFPFRPTAIGEDVAWAREVLLAGFHLRFVPDAIVIHSHNRSARYEFQRTYVLHRRLYELFGLRTVPTLPALAGAIASSTLLHMKCVARQRRPLEGPRAVALALAWPLGQYLGALSAIRGWKPLRTTAV